MSLHDVGDLTCPRCGESLEQHLGGEISASVDEKIRVAVDCPSCDAPIDIVIESALPDAVGLDVYVEESRKVIGR
jgi:uncharacterized protein (UPF0212 family)